MGAPGSHLPLSAFVSPCSLPPDHGLTAHTPRGVILRPRKFTRAAVPAGMPERSRIPLTGWDCKKTRRCCARFELETRSVLPVVSFAPEIAVLDFSRQQTKCEAPDSRLIRETKPAVCPNKLAK